MMIATHAQIARPDPRHQPSSPTITGIRPGCRSAAGELSRSLKRPRSPRSEAPETAPASAGSASSGIVLSDAGIGRRIVGNGQDDLGKGAAGESVDSVGGACAVSSLSVVQREAVNRVR
jgi:hypothetical protein